MEIADGFKGGKLPVVMMWMVKTFDGPSLRGSGLIDELLVERP